MSIEPAEFAILQGLVSRHAAIVLEPGKEYLAETRLGPVARGAGCASVTELLRKVDADPRSPIVGKVVEAMTTNETSFFRDIHPFEALRTTVVPELLKARAAERTLNLWCAAASSGQEPYSVAMTLLEHFPELRGWKVRFVEGQGAEQTLEADHVISSAPMKELVKAIQPGVSSQTQAAANGLRYRDFLTVALIVRPSRPFDDNWIYIHEPGVKVGRVQNFGSWSPEMVPDPKLACYGLEYFCFEGDGLWNMSDADLIALGSKELQSLGLVREGDVLDGHVVRQPKAYPVYDDDYARHVAVIRDELEARYPQLHLVGRNGMHKYNNQDHSMMTALLVARNILAGKAQYDVWRVNQDAEYHEEGSRDEDQTGRQVPRAKDSDS